MAKRYARLNWQNAPSVATPINATNLNKMDKGIDDIDTSLNNLENSIVGQIVNDPTKINNAAVNYSLANQINELNKNIRGFKSLGILGAAKSENDLSALIDNIPSMYSTSYVCLVSVEFAGSAVFTAMGSTSGGVIQIIGFNAGGGYEVQRALSYYGAPVYRQRNASTWGNWKRCN